MVPSGPFINALKIYGGDPQIFVLEREGRKQNTNNVIQTSKGPSFHLADE